MILILDSLEDMFLGMTRPLAPPPQQLVLVSQYKQLTDWAEVLLNLVFII